jgi:hypothetical protein
MSGFRRSRRKMPKNISISVEEPTALGVPQMTLIDERVLMLLIFYCSGAFDGSKCLRNEMRDYNNVLLVEEDIGGCYRWCSRKLERVIRAGLHDPD